MPPQQPQQQQQQHIESPIEGSRIINLHKLQEYIGELSTHSAQCQGSVILSGEVREGLASVLSSKCTSCGHNITLQTSQKVKGPNGYQRWECNLAAVWGQMVTGGGHSRLQESMSIAGVPVMTKASFIHTERAIGDLWNEQLMEYMKEAGKEEKRLAIERGDYHHDVPAITVYVDGGWSKRSHKHSYNANSGVAIIIGQATGKLLYIGVRNKYCSACSQGIPQDKHVCYKNWSSSSSEMETDILLEGFRAAESTHGVRYMRVVGDGDSSVYSTLLLNVPIWGRDIQKLECANHACKCYRGALERVVQENPSYKGAGGLTQKMRQRLVSAARCAIRMRSKEPDRKKAIKLLERDLINGPLHCFGQHDKCSPDFCSTAKAKRHPSAAAENQAALLQSTSLRQPSSNQQSLQQNEQSSSLMFAASVSPLEPQESTENRDDDMEVSDTSSDDTDILGIADIQERLWRDTLQEDPDIEEDCRQGGRPTNTKPNQKMLHDIQVAVSRLVTKAAQLIGNETTNLAENWMHVRTKYDGGKVINRSQSGSWEHRCMGAGLQHNIGKQWGPTIWTKMTASSPNNIFSTTAENIARISEKDRLRKAKDEVKARRRKNKYSRKDNSLAARKAYSRHDNQVEPDDVTSDISPDILSEMKENYYETNVVVTKVEAMEIESETRDQASNDRWKAERRKRLTASRVGSILKMRKTTSRASKVKELLYNKFSGNQATTYGMTMEEVARTDYITYQQQHQHPVNVTGCGLFVALDNPWLASTPDGIVEDPSEEPSTKGLLEIKNPYSKRNMTLSQACSSNSFCLKEEKKDNETTYSLKRKHDYYFQVQCQMYCVNLDWCDFVLRTDKELHLERIYRDSKWWDQQLPKLKDFYDNALLPELACPRFGKGPIREPPQPPQQ